MDDLKVVLYIVIAIIWVVYNNYKKISQASKKRDISRPPDEVIQENWPKTTQQPARPVIQKPRQILEKQIPKTSRPILERTPLPSRKPISLERTPLPSRKPIRKTSLIEKKETLKAYPRSREGGITTPSKVVQFEEPAYSETDQNSLVSALRSMDLRHGIIMAEILKRPYS